jgi:hypothetical protein
MATKKKSAAKKSSSGSGPKSKRISKNKVGKVMHEYKQHELTSGRSGKKVKSRKQAIAIGLSEARRAGANIPPSPGAKKAAKKKSAAKKTAAKKSSAGRKSTAKKTTGAKKASTKKSAAKKSARSR